MTTVYLVRHATHDRVDAVLCGRMSGVMLGARGRAQASAVAALLASSKAGAVLTSPLQRAIETAAPIAEALGIGAKVEMALEEIDFGDWTGRRFDSLASDPTWRTWNSARATARPPGGESMAAAQSRIAALLDRLAEAGGTPTILISHGDIIRAAILAILGMPLEAYHRFDIEPASVSRLELWPGGGKVVGLNARTSGSTGLSESRGKARVCQSLADAVVRKTIKD